MSKARTGGSTAADSGSADGSGDEETQQKPAVKLGFLHNVFAEVGNLANFSWHILVAFVDGLRKGHIHWREIVTQMWFLAHVTTVSAMLVMVPLGVGVALQIGSLAGQIGADSYSGAVASFLIIGQAAPLVCALIIAGVGGSAICADLGARTIREEIDAMEVLGIPVMQRLVVPRIIAVTLVCLLLNAIVMIIGLGASLLVHVFVLDGNATSFLRNLVNFSQPSDYIAAAVKAGAFAIISGVVASYRGLTVKKGAQGVGDAVNETVVLAFILVFVANLAISELYPLLIPAKGDY